jgi:hypothetical protein
VTPHNRTTRSRLDRQDDSATGEEALLVSFTTPDSSCRMVDLRSDAVSVRLLMGSVVRRMQTV